MAYAAKRVLVDDLFEDFKAQVNKSFLFWIYDLLFDLDEDEIPDDEFIEGSGEKQIDVIRIEDDTENRKAHIHILQTKKSNGFSSNTVVLIGNGISTILEANRTAISKLTNKVLGAKILEIRERLKQYGYGSIDLSVYYATLGDSNDVSLECKEEIEKLNNKLSQVGFASFNFQILGAAELYDIWYRKNTTDRNINQDINIVYDVNRPSIIELATEEYKAIVCTISGAEIARLAGSEPKDAIFDMNLRGHLGMSGRVNANIYKAAQDKNEAKTFWLKNNGITMVCSHLDVNKDPDEPAIKVRNVQIVNGCQTSVTLREAASAGKLQESVRVLAKIYELADMKLINQIVLATNNQNSIVSRDLYANDESQLLIQQTIQGKLGYFYERKRGEARSNGKTRIETIDSEKAGQAYLAIKKKLPTISRAQKYRLYETELYVDIFQKSDPLQLALCYFIYEYCKKHGGKRAKQLLKGDQERSLLTYGVFHLARVFAYFVFSREALPSDPEEILALVRKLRKSDKSLAAPFEKAIKFTLQVLKRSKAASANNYFKAQLAQDQITGAIVKLV